MNLPVLLIFVTNAAMCQLKITKWRDHFQSYQGSADIASSLNGLEETWSINQFDLSQI